MGNAVKLTATYDAADRLTAELWRDTSGNSELHSFTYAYDKAGNRLKTRRDGVDTYYVYDADNRLRKRGSNAVLASPVYYDYDSSGSLIKQHDTAGPATTYFDYNAAGLIARITWPDATQQTFYYDGNLQRYAINEAGTVSYFLWDGLNILQERDASGAVKVENTNCVTPIPGIAQLVESYRPPEAAGDQKIYPVMDVRGSITKWVKGDGTTVSASREYDAFGVVLESSGGWPSPFGYQGQAWMELPGYGGEFMLSPTRIYNVGDGRFTQRDPRSYFRRIGGRWVGEVELPLFLRTARRLFLPKETLNWDNPFNYNNNSVDPSGWCSWTEWLLNVCDAADTAREQFRRNAERFRELGMTDRAHEAEAAAERDLSEGALSQGVKDVLTDPGLSSYLKCYSACAGDSIINNLVASKLPVPFLPEVHPLEWLTGTTDSPLPGRDDWVGMSDVTEWTFTGVGAYAEQIARENEWSYRGPRYERKVAAGKQLTPTQAKRLLQHKKGKAARRAARATKLGGAALTPLQLASEWNNCYEKCKCHLQRGGA